MSPKSSSRSKFSSPHTSPSTPSPSSSRHRHSQSLQSLQSIRSLQSIQLSPSSPRKPPRPLLERLLSPLALSPMQSPLHSPLSIMSFEAQQMQAPVPPSPFKESRSERLLRAALIKDDLALAQTPIPMAVPQEPTLMLLGLPSPPLARPTHRRRHSHAPVASRTSAADVLRKTGYGYGYGAEDNGNRYNGYSDQRSDQKRGGRALEFRDRGHGNGDEFRQQQGYEQQQPLSSSPSSSSIASSLYPQSHHSQSTHHHQSHSVSTPHSPKQYYGGDAELMYPSPTPSFPPYSIFPTKTETKPPLVSEVRPHRGYSTPDVRRNVSTDPRRVDSSPNPNPRRGDFSRSDSPSPSPHPRHTLRQTPTSTSTPPSPYIRQQQAPKTASPYRPRSPALHQSSTRPHSPSPSSRMTPHTPTQTQTERSQKHQSLPANIHSELSGSSSPFASNQAIHVVQTTPGIPLPMTPHEKALRARLERVLYGNGNGNGNGNGGAVLMSPSPGKVRKEGEARLERRERCGSNEVRDETGGWPWRERERDMISTPPTSGSSSGSGSHSPNSPHSQPSQLSQEQHTHTTSHSMTSSAASIAQPKPQRQTSPSFTRNNSPTLHRTRGSSESTTQIPNPSSSSSNTTPNRNRSTTTTSPFQSRIPQPAVYKSQPVTPRTPARGEMQQRQQDSLRSQSRTPRSPAPAPMALNLPTTPRRATTVGPTAPRTPRTPAAAPPRTPKTAVPASSTTPRTPRTAAGAAKGSDAEPRVEAESENKDENKEEKSGGVLTPPPTPPVRARVPESSPGPFRLRTGLGVGRPGDRGRSTSAEGSEEDGGGGVDDVGAGTGTGTDTDADADLGTGTESDVTGEHEGGEVGRLGLRRPFNARKASERLRGTEGYVSFASVEGLGEPPDTPVCETEGEVRGRRGFGLGVLAGWWGGRTSGEVA